MKNVCRFNLPSGAVLEIAPETIKSITRLSDNRAQVNGYGYFYAVAHTQEEAQAIWDAAKPLTVAPEKRQSLLDAAIAINDAFEWGHTKEGVEKWGSIKKRLIELGEGGPL